MDERIGYWNRMLSCLRGHRVFDAYMDMRSEIDDRGIPTIVFLDDKNRKLWLQIVQDDEGNGAGSFYLHGEEPFQIVA